MKQLLRVLLGAVLLGGALLACAAQDADPSNQLQEADFQNEFARFIRTFNRTYDAAGSASARGGSSEFNTRYSVFKTNLQLIRAHNAAAARGEHTYTLAVNQFADVSDEEYRQQRAASRARIRESLRNRPRTNETATPGAGADAAASRSLLQTAPTAIDWVTAGRVPVPLWDTVTCGGDYAVQSSDAVASLFAVVGGYTPVPLSAQQILDCSGPQGNGGCSWGTPDAAFDYLRGSGMYSDLEYPWVASQWTCRQPASGALPEVPPILGFMWAPDEAALQARLALQPVVVALSTDAVPAFRFYYEGVFSDAQCGEELDMLMLVVGYGHDAASGKDFWRLKNHWATIWGDGGYMRIERGIGMCGFGMYSIYPTHANLQ